MYNGVLKKLAQTTLCGVIAVTWGLSAQAQVSYQLDVTAFYQFGAPSDLYSGRPSGNPDTGFFRITNSGSSIFTGSIGATAVTPSLTDFSFLVSGLTLNPGDHLSFSINDESSNNGGFNPDPSNTSGPQLGAKIFLNGSVLSGSSSDSVNLFVYDKDIHSGVKKTNPFGITLDNYILQGGDPFGRDTSDDFEVNQAPGTYSFIQRGNAVPEPSVVALLGASGLVGLLALRRRSRR